MISRSCLRLRNLAVVPPRSSPAERPSSAIVAIAASRGRNSLGFFSSSSSPSHPSPSQPRPRRLPFPSSNITSNTNTTTTSHRSFHPSTPRKCASPTPRPGARGHLVPEDEAVVERVRARRAPRPLQPLDLALLHSPPVADGWNSFLGAIRTKTESVPAGLRELAICRVAVCNRAWYEWAHHAPLAIAAGVSEAFMNDYVKGLPGGDLEHAVTDEVKARCADEWGVGAREWAVLRYTDEMTRNVHVPDAVFAEIKGLFGDKEIVELTATVAAYNCVSRFLVALDVGERNATGPDDAGPAH
ncbi:carboxymuconolactone decarboxylase family protein [Microdochium nivale]|nr:carboxymuconolactone decarboxylase family protein [Microdochium nivale]